MGEENDTKIMYFRDGKFLKIFSSIIINIR